MSPVVSLYATFFPSPSPLLHLSLTQNEPSKRGYLVVIVVVAA
jgi:hypothetical protein